MKQLAVFSENFLTYCSTQKKLSKATIRAYAFDLAHFKRFIAVEKKQNPKLKIFTKQTLQLYLKFLVNQYSVKTIKRKMACLRSFFVYLEAEDLIRENPFLHFRLNLKEPYRIPCSMSFDEIKKILTYVYECLYEAYPEDSPRKFNPTHPYFLALRDVAVLELLFASGARVSELCSLKFSDFDPINHSFRIIGKGNKERFLYLSSMEVVSAFKKYLSFRLKIKQSYPYVFISKFGSPLSTQAVRNLICKYVNGAGINKNITPHAFRHTFATLMLEEGADIKYVQEFLGHSSISTTQIYLHLSEASKRRVLAKLHPRRKMTFGKRK